MCWKLWLHLNKGKTSPEIDAIDNDIDFMKLMISDRKAPYSGIDKVVTKQIQLQKKGAF